ncbi:hypothetical protein LIER_37968 [Lithospermum erythrorhizon]|uniref:Mitochondrial protein n=1 Tax=Lithospermum erythrorhizon TaxID=34254 RepID=A0AAV3PSM8_LITER
MNEEHTNDGTPVNDSWSYNKEHVADSKSVNDTWDDNRPIQPASQIQKNDLVDNIIREIDQGVTTRRKEPVDYRKMVGLIGERCFISKVEPKNVDEALKDEHWINALQHELLQFQRNDVWELVPRPNDHNVIGTKWIFKNKFDKQELLLEIKQR